MIELETLRDLARRGDGADRAFVDGALRMRWPKAGAARGALEDVHAELAAAAARAHADLRARIASGALRGAALRACFEAPPPAERDHFVEEVLGIAYPPLAEPAPERELVTYCPSGYDEIVHAFDVTGLGAGDRFLDVGAGAGKSVLLAALLCGARGEGIERDEPVYRMAAGAADALAADARFVLADARDAAFPEADVVFMYIPFTGATLAAALARLLARPPRFLCASAVDLACHPTLVPAGEARSWLHVYACGSTMRA
ncbi:MAG: class I SAM-dependent methyltransferase [Labilithrix sp.]|nr:class I SAM-dependent methyltransferase [Labilithrix sp.]MCW5813142.1 class I SAM-dependent methyltransferase [Labilithrix sp.]